MNARSVQSVTMVDSLCDVKTDERKVISYLVKPLKDQVMRAFREK